MSFLHAACRCVKLATLLFRHQLNVNTEVLPIKNIFNMHECYLKQQFHVHFAVEMHDFTPRASSTSDFIKTDAVPFSSDMGFVAYPHMARGDLKTQRIV